MSPVRNFWMLRLRVSYDISKIDTIWTIVSYTLEPDTEDIAEEYISLVVRWWWCLLIQNYLQLWWICEQTKWFHMGRRKSSINFSKIIHSQKPNCFWSVELLFHSYSELLTSMNIAINKWLKISLVWLIISFNRMKLRIKEASSVT